MSTKEARFTSANGGGLPLAEDLLKSAGEMAEFFYGEDTETNRRKVYHMSDKHGLPTFKLGGVLCGRRSTFLRWIEEQEGSRA